MKCPKCNGTQLRPDLDGDMTCILCGYVYVPPDQIEYELKHFTPFTRRIRRKIPDGLDS